MNNRGGGNPVVVVKKKSFSFQKKPTGPVLSKKTAENHVGKHVEEGQDSSDSKVDMNFSHQLGSLKNDSIRNLDDEYAQVKPKPTTDSTVSSSEKAKKQISKFQTGVRSKNNIPKLEDEQEKARRYFDRETSSAKQDKPKKDLISGLKIISNSKEKEFNTSADTSAFLASKGKYEEGKKRKNYLDDADEEQVRLRSIASMKRAREKAKRDQGGELLEKKEKEVTIPETITVQELAGRMAIRSADVVKELMKMGMMITASKPIDADTAELVAAEFGYTVVRVADSDIEKILDNPEKNNISKLKSRAPIVSVMGHVDHGKTSLLDALRETNIASGESGGITQHIGASKVKVAKDKYITFLDTPGHEAFTEMRLRGAHATDMVILVVAADDGVKDQTIEAINHAKAAGIPIIVAVNKIDKEGASTDKVLGELLSHNVIVESMGGEALYVEVSAKEKLNLDKLIDAINLQADLLDLKANPECVAEGVVIESRIDKAKGVLATLLVKHGTLKSGDIILAGTAFGKVKKLTNEQGRVLQNTKPSDPAEMLGLNISPDAGDQFYVVDSEKTARDLIEYRQNKKKDRVAAKRSKRTLEDIFSEMTGNEVKELSLVIKGDVKGSVEAINTSLEKIIDEEVKINIIHSAVGGITESDLTLAKASGGIVLGFNVRLGNGVKEDKDVDVRYYSIIYDLIDDIKLAVSGMLKPVEKEVDVGKGLIRQVFDLTKYGKVAGTYITSGVAKRAGKCRVIRDSVVVISTEIKALKHFKDDVKEVKKGSECGVSFENFLDFKEGDELEFFEVVEEQRKI
jgi:translation initiation factor IF-2